MARRNAFERPGRTGWYIRIRHKGKERIKLAGRTKTKAEQNLTRLEDALLDGKDLDSAIEEIWGRTGENLSFREITAKYKESAVTQKRTRTYQEDCKRLEIVTKASWTRKPLRVIRPADIARWLDEIGKKGPKGKPLAPSTLNRYRSLVSVVFTYAVTLGYVAENPVAKLKKFDESGRARDEFFDTKEAIGLLHNCSPALRLLALAAAGLGLRQGTLLQLRWRNVDFESETVLVQASIAKGKKPQREKMPPPLVVALKAARMHRQIHDIHGDDLVFLSPNGLPWNRHALWRQTRTAIDTCEAIPLEKRKKLCFHSLRHSFGSLLTMRGLHPRALQELMGHSDPRLTARYSHLRPEGMDQAAKELGELLDLGDDLLNVREGTADASRGGAA